MKVSLHITELNAAQLQAFSDLIQGLGADAMFTSLELAEQPAVSVPPMAPTVTTTGPDLRAFAAAPATPFTPPAVAPILVMVAPPIAPPPPPAATPIPGLRTLEALLHTQSAPAPKVPDSSFPDGTRLSVSVTPQRGGGLPLPTIELDVTGLPWDGRIHSSSKAKTADGWWRARRNLDPKVLAEVTGELKATMSAEAPPPAPSTPETPSASGLDFPQFMRLAVTRLNAEPDFQAKLINACNAVGVPSLPALSNRPDLIPAVAASLGIAP